MEKYKADKKTDDLFKTILRLKNLPEARSFFRDLCTLEEIKNMADRWEAAQMIAKGVPYREIAEKLELSTATVSRVAFWLNDGAGGYKTALGKSGSHHNPSSFGKGQRR